MGDERTLLKMLVAGALSDTLKAAGFGEKALAKLSKDSNIALEPQEIATVLGKIGRSPLKLPPNIGALASMHPTDAAEVFSRIGSQLQARVDELALQLPAIKKGMSAQAMGKAAGNASSPTIAAYVAARAVGRAAFRDWLDPDFRNASDLLDRALTGLGEALATRVKDFRRRVPLGEDLEAYVRGAAQELSRADARALVRAVHTKICAEMTKRLNAVLDVPALRTGMEDAFGAVKVGVRDELAVEYRRGLKEIFAGSDAAAEVDIVIAGLDGTARARAVGQIFSSVASDSTKEMLAKHFDADGARRLLSAYGSFKKIYTVRRRKGAMESLIGWLYECSKFVADLAQESSLALRDTLAAAVEARGLNITVGRPFMHTDSFAPTVAGAKLRQATDVIGTVPLTGGGRTVHVLSAPIEGKGESGVAAGLKQIADLLQRLKDGNEVRTEHGVFVVGKDLFLTVEAALRAVGAPTGVAAEIAATRGLAMDAIVVSPLPEAVVRKTFATLFASGKARYVAHPISREEMVRIADDLAPSFSLLARK